ncbi:hypothetical protein [Streptomyces sp. NPDC102437]
MPPLQRTAPHGAGEAIAVAQRDTQGYPDAADFEGLEGALTVVPV